MIVLTLIELLAIFLSCACAIHTPKEPSAGGPCDYKKYQGQAKIISISPKTGPRHNSRDIYEVKFSFSTTQEIVEKFAQPEGKEFLMLLNNSAYPNTQFLEKYNIRVGKVFECSMNVIVQGTCTPVTFEFPTIRLDDYIDKWEIQYITKFIKKGADNHEITMTQWLMFG